MKFSVHMRPTSVHNVNGTMATSVHHFCPFCLLRARAVRPMLNALKFVSVGVIGFVKLNAFHLSAHSVHKQLQHVRDLVMSVSF